VTWRDVRIVDGNGELVDVLNLTSNDIRVQDNYNNLRSMIVEAATSERVADSPWQNRVEPLDVSNDGFVVANDVLRIINRINDVGAGELPSTTETIDNYYDVTGDNFATSRDALVIIRHINLHSQIAAGEPEPKAAAKSVDAYFAAAIADLDDDEDDRGA
jgi:hypothetical protein